MTLTRFFRCSAWLGAFASTAAFAQVESIDLNASPLTLNAGALYTDNINPTLSEELAAVGGFIAPKGKLVAKTEGAWYMLDYDARLETYSVSDDTTLIDDSQSFNRGRLRGLGRFFIADNWHLDLSAEYLGETQRFGTGISSLRRDVLEADELARTSAGITLVYGTDTSRRSVAVTLATRDWEFDDNNPYSPLFDVKQTIARVNLSFRLSQASRWLVRLEGIQEDYDSLLREDTDVINALLGVEWRPTGKSRLEALIGAYQRDFDNQDSNSGLSWLVSYSGTPREDVQLKFDSSRFSDVSRSEVTTDTIRQDATLAVNYLFSDQWHFGVGAEVVNTEFVDVDGSFELDETRGYVETRLLVNDHQSIALRFQTEDVSSDDDAQDFEQQLVRLDWQYAF